jgi:hypothetical protein
MRNLLPVTIGNIIGGSIPVAIVYWFVYLREAVAQPAGDGTARGHGPESRSQRVTPFAKLSAGPVKSPRHPAT